MQQTRLLMITKLTLRSEYCSRLRRLRRSCGGWGIPWTLFDFRGIHVKVRISDRLLGNKNKENSPWAQSSYSESQEGHLNPRVQRVPACQRRCSRRQQYGKNHFSPLNRTLSSTSSRSDFRLNQQRYVSFDIFEKKIQQNKSWSPILIGQLVADTTHVPGGINAFCGFGVFLLFSFFSLLEITTCSFWNFYIYMFIIDFLYN